MRSIQSYRSVNSAAVLSRRTLLRGLGFAGGLAAVDARGALAAVRAAAQAPASDAEFWRRIQGEFLLDKDWTYLNNGTLGPTPKPVYYTVVERYHDLAQDPGQPNRDQSDAAEGVRRKAAAFVGATP